MNAVSFAIALNAAALCALAALVWLNGSHGEVALIEPGVTQARPASSSDEPLHPRAALTRAPCTPRWWPEPPQLAPSFAPTRELLLADALAQLSSESFAERGIYTVTQLAQCVAEREARGTPLLSGERRFASPLG